MLSVGRVPGRTGSQVALIHRKGWEGDSICTGSCRACSSSPGHGEGRAKKWAFDMGRYLGSTQWLS